MRHVTLNSWLGQIRASVLISEGDVRDTAQRNMQVFHLSANEAAATNVRDIELFLEAAAREYAMKAAGSRAGFWFYAWFDEMSGTLRCSAVPVGDAESLPFRCQLSVHDSPTAVAESLLNSSHLDGLPIDEFTELDLNAVDWDRGDEINSSHVLEVFARRLPRPVE